MHHHYFDRASADDDDVALGEAKILGHVPDTCLLGGVHVWVIILAGEDPCGGCYGPRKRCGGRPMTKTSPFDVGGPAGARIERLIEQFQAETNRPDDDDPTDGSGPGR